MRMPLPRLGWQSLSLVSTVLASHRFRRAYSGVLHGGIEMRLHRTHTAAVALLAAFSFVAAMFPAEAATRAQPKKVQRVDGWGSPYYLTGGKAVFAPAGSTFSGYPSWARVAFENQGG